MKAASSGTTLTQGNSIWMDQAYLNFSNIFGVDAVRVGRHGLNELGGLLAYKSGSLDGITFTKKISPNTTVKAATLAIKEGKAVTGNGNTDWQDAQYISLSSKVNEQLTVGGLFLNDNVKTSNATDGTKVYGVSAAYKLGKWTLLAEYDKGDYKNPKSTYSALGNPKAYGFQISNGKNVKGNFVLCPAYVTDISKPGDSAISIAYRYIDPLVAPGLAGSWNNGTVWSTAYKPDFTTNNKGWVIDYQYVLMKNINLDLCYQSIKYAKTLGSAVAGSKVNDMFSMTLYTVF